MFITPLIVEIFTDLQFFDTNLVSSFREMLSLEAYNINDITSDKDNLEDGEGITRRGLPSRYSTIPFRFSLITSSVSFLVER